MVTVRAPNLVRMLTEAGYGNPWGIIIEPSAGIYSHSYNITAMVGSFVHAVMREVGVSHLHAIEVSLPFLHFDFNLILPATAVIKNALAREQGLEPLSIQFRLKRTNTYNDNEIANVAKVIHIITNTAKLEFVAFYERFWPEIKANAEHDLRRIPKPWDFARVVRNAIGHNCITINDPRFVPVKWYWLEYGPAQNGRQIFDVDLALPDLWVLMFEMEDALSLMRADERFPLPSKS